MGTKCFFIGLTRKRSEEEEGWDPLSTTKSDNDNIRSYTATQPNPQNENQCPFLCAVNMTFK